MELSLAHEGLWAYASGFYPRPISDAVNPSSSTLKELRLWTIAEGKTRANIILACEHGLRSDLMSAPVSTFTSAQLWTHLEKTYGKADPSVMANIRLTLSVRVCPDDSSTAAVEHAAWLQRENNKLLGSTMEFNDLHLAMQLLATLPKSMEPVRQSIMSRDITDITFENVRSAIVRFDQSEQSSHTMSRIVGTQGPADSPASGAMATTSRPSPSRAVKAWRCSFHKSNSHTDAQCRSQQGTANVKVSKENPTGPAQPSTGAKARIKGSANSSTASDKKRDAHDSDSDAYFASVDSSSSSITQEASALRTSTSPVASRITHTVWMVDSAATHHFSSSKDCMTQFEPTNDRVKLGDDHHLPIAGIGNIRALMQHENSEPTKVIFKGVRYVPGLAVNLLSVACMAAQGLTTTFSRKRAVIYNPQMDVIAVARLDRTGHYTLTTNPRADPAATSASASVASSTDTLGLWHQKLAHLGAKSIRLLFNNEMGTGVDCKAIAASIRQGSVPRGPITCDSCDLGKSHRQPFKPSSHKATAPLQLVHTDLCGPISNGLYEHVVVDDASRFIWLKIHANKENSTILAALKEYKAWAEARQHQHGHRLLAIRADGGGEFRSKISTQWYTEHGIDPQTTTAHTSQSNGVAERMHRTLMDRTRTVLSAAGLSTAFWTEALKYVAYTTNRCPSAALEGMTPYEAWTGEKPDLSRLHPFGCVAIRHVLPADRKSGKLSPRAVRCAMVGYTANKEAYLLWDPTERRVVASRDVVFRDDEWWSHESTVVRGGHNESSDSSTTPHINSIPPDTDDDDDDPDEMYDGDDHHHDGIAQSDSDSDQDREPLSNLLLPRSSQPVQSAPTLPTRPRDTPSVTLSTRLRPLPSRSNRSNTWATHGTSSRSALATSTSESDDAERWREPRQAEIHSLAKAETYTVVPRPAGVNVVGCKWVDKEKTLPDGSVKLKSRLVAQGFTQRPGTDFVETYSPTCRLDSLRALIALAAQHDWEFHHMDVKSAYLNGKLNETIYMRQPKGFELPGKRDHVCLLHKGLYGLKQAGRTWNQTIDPALRGIGLTPLASDHCVYSLQGNERHVLILALYVDDLFIFANDKDLLHNYKKKFHSLFEMEDLGEARLVLGMTVTRDRAKKTITLSQPGYVSGLLEKFGATDLNPTTTPMEAGLQLTRCPEDETPSPEQTNYYQSAVGGLMYAACATRPDIAYAVSSLSQHCARPSAAHFNALKRVFRYLRGTTNQSLTFTGTNDRIPQLVAYTDSDYASNPDHRRSVTGYAFILCGGPISWASRRQATVAQSSVEAEYMAMAEGVKEAVWWRSFLGELSQRSSSPTPIYVDNTGSISLAHNPEHHARTKHIDVKYHITREHLQCGTITLHHVPTQDNTADVFTKALSRPAYVQHRSKLGLTSPA
jgi:hypothetical protein